MDPKLLARVRALLAKAESSEFEAEKAMFNAAAMDIAQRHGLDAEAIRAAADGRQPEAIGRMDCPLPIGFHIELGLAYGGVAEAMGCQCAQYGSRREARESCLQMVGPVRVLDALKVLLPSLDVQLRRAMPRGRDELYQGGFILGFGEGVAAQIRARMGEIEHEVKGTGAELVLAGRQRLVEAEFRRQFPHCTENPDFAWDDRGRIKGAEAGKHADLGDRSLRDVRQLTTRERTRS